MANIITITSGKGGVGKTSISLNLSLALAAAGHRVCLFDADLGLANVNILTGIYPEYGLEDVINGHKGLPDIMIRDFQGVDIIPGSSGVEQLADLKAREAERLIRAFLDIRSYDFFIFDTSAGISAQVLAFCRASREMVLVVTPEPTSLTDAYSLLKVLAKRGGLPPVRVVVNQVKTAASARSAYSKLRNTVKKFLNLKISALGVVAHDANVPISVVSQIPFTMLFPDTDASRCIRTMALKLVKAGQKDMPLEIFWDRCLGLLGTSATDAPEKREEREKREKSLESGATRAAGPVPEGAGDQDALQERLAAIENTMSRLLDEVTAIKQMLTPDTRNRPPRSGDPDNRPADSLADIPTGRTAEAPDIQQAESGPVILDFEAWMRQQTP